MYNLKRSTRQTLVPLTTGDRTRIKLLNDENTEYLNIRGSARVNITTAATGVRNRGSVWALFTELGIEENGQVRWLGDPRALAHASEAATPSAKTKTRLATGAVQTLTLVDQIRLPFAHPFAINPQETAFREENIQQSLDFFATLDGTNSGIARVLNVGAGVATVDQISLVVQQGYNESNDPTKLPLFRPTVRKIVQAVNGATSALEIFIRTTNRLRGMTISQIDNTVGEVTDILNTVQLRGDKTFVIGPEPMPWDDLAREQEFEFGGDVYATSQGSHVHLNFEQFGRLSRVLNPMVQDVNMRLVVDCQPTSAAGATGSNIVIHLYELEQDPYVDPTTGRRVTAPTLPFNA